MKNGLIKKIYQDKTIARVSKKIKLLGCDCKYDAIDLLNKRLILTLVLFFIILVISSYGYILAPLISLAFYLSIEYFYLDLNIKKRAIKLDYEAQFFFEILALSLESGRDLKKAISISATNINGLLSKEFLKSIEEMEFGKSLTEALNDMKQRIPSPTINNVILNITQSSIFGSNIIDSLNNQIDYLREQRLMNVKANIARLPIKISVISVLFFVPIMLLIILAPVIINMVG